VTPRDRFAPRELTRRLIRAVVDRARLGGSGSGDFTLRLDYPPSSANAPRYGFGRPPHRRLAELLEGHAERYRAQLAALEQYENDLLAIGRDRSDDPLQPYWDQYWLFGLDAISLYGIIRSRAPSSYVEIGSGFSTMFAARAIRDGGLDTPITSVDPEPRQGVDALCQRAIRRPLEEVDLAVFDHIHSGDVVFMDGSHRVFMNSDATVFFLDVIPRLNDGVVVGVHDIFLPFDYPPEWASSFYSEQYLLAAYLLAETPFIKPILPCTYILANSERYPSRLVGNPHFAEAARRWNEQVPPGVTFWFETNRPPVGE
jgi:predicted O-methyltransferase YrrM